MNHLHILVSEDIVPLGQFKAQAAGLLRRLGKSGQPLVITQNGKPAAVMLSPAEFDRMQERQRFMEAVAAGLADAEAGRMISTAELERRLAAKRAERMAE